MALLAHALTGPTIIRYNGTPLKAHSAAHGTDTTNSTITNVKDGAISDTSKDKVVNGSQLKNHQR
ncbi:hypothetical protein MJ568_18885 [Escherichia coli]|nr:hypothetical protein MJ568_18885 [Escherichia coli]